MVGALFFIKFLSDAGGLLCSKKTSNTLIGKGSIGYALYISVVSVISCTFFYISSGFNLSVNFRTLVYSFIFSLMCIASSILAVMANRLSQISNMNIVRSATSVVFNSSIGFIIFSEVITKTKVISILLMTLSVIFVSFQIGDNGKDKKFKQQGHGTSKGYYIKYFLVMFALVIVGCLVTIINKLYAIDKAVCDNNSFFFFTNVFQLIFALLCLLVSTRCRLHKIVPMLKELWPLKILVFSGNNICSNINSLVNILILQRVDVSVNSPISSALAIVAGAAVSLILREKLKITSFIAVIISIIAIFSGFLNI